METNNALKSQKNWNDDCVYSSGRRRYLSDSYNTTNTFLSHWLHPSLAWGSRHCLPKHQCRECNVSCLNDRLKIGSRSMKWVQWGKADTAYHHFKDRKVWLQQSLAKLSNPLVFVTARQKAQHGLFHQLSYCMGLTIHPFILPKQTLPNLAVQLPLVVQRLQWFQVLLKDGNVWLQEGLPIGLKKRQTIRCSWKDWEWVS